MKRKRKNTSLIFKIILLVLLVLIVISFPLVLQKVIKVKKLECTSQYGKCGNEFDFSSYLPTDYITMKKKITTDLIKNFQVNSFLIQYKIPDSITIELNLKKPIYAIFDGIDKYYLVDKNGLIIKQSSETNLPTLIKSGYIAKAGEEISEQDKFALRLIEKVDWLYSAKIGQIESDYLKIILKEGIYVFFPLEGDVDVLVGSLRLIFSRLNAGKEGIKMDEILTTSDIREIDLRFKSAVLR